MSKGSDPEKFISDWEKEGTLEKKMDIIEKIPEVCLKCNSRAIKYWDKTDEEFIFQCKICKTYITIPLRMDKLKFYFSS
ncbi:MAG: hypothetical protein ACXAEX_08535 [Promethearchaeota archaeon]